MRKIEDGPRQISASAWGSEEGIVELKYRQSSSCEVLFGLSSAYSARRTHTLPTHITQSLRLAGGCGWYALRSLVSSFSGDSFTTGREGPAQD